MMMLETSKHVPKTEKRWVSLLYYNDVEIKYRRSIRMILNFSVGKNLIKMGRNKVLTKGA